MPGGSGASGLVLAEPASRWSDLTLRVVSALVLLPVTLFCIWAGGYAFLLLVAVAGVVLASEWLAMCGYSSLDPLLVWFPICIVVVAISAGLGAAGTGLIVVLIGTVLAGVFHPRHGLASAPRGPGSALHQDPWSALHHALASGFRQGVGEAFHRARRDVGAGGPVEPGHDDGEASDRQGTAGTLRADHIGCAGQDIRGRTGHEDGKHDTSVGGPRCPRFHLAFGVPYIGLAAIALLWLRADPAVGLANTLFVLAIVWASDIGAYMIGRLVGGPKLAPSISPGKTWSGAAGGLASAAVAALAVAACVSPEIPSSHVIGPGLVLGIISQAGDLLESALKRHFGVKDSGRIIPGHGGLLDRLDALLAVAPVAAVLAFTVGRGVVLWR